MKTERNILAAFLLNLSFSVLELFGGFFTGSIAIVSDAIHDFGDSVSIGISYFLEKKSKGKPDSKYTYGYARYSVLGAVITSAILTVGSLLIIWRAVDRLIHPEEIRPYSMMIFAVFGLLMNLLAAYFTHGGGSLNQRAVNLHMLEDVLGWAAVLVGAVLIRLTGFYFIDPLLSMGVAVFILVESCRSFSHLAELFLEKIPRGIDISELTEHILAIDGVVGVHHVHVRSFDGVNNSATMHVVISEGDYAAIKRAVKEELREHGIAHATLELESADEECTDVECSAVALTADAHHHHHHHHH
ncbi:MAG: cation transporter [Clostridia bacterium]|nr:cation transporter [Clostridia bacterium]